MSAVNCTACKYSYLVAADPLDYNSPWICLDCNHQVDNKVVVVPTYIIASFVVSFVVVVIISSVSSDTKRPLHIRFSVFFSVATKLHSSYFRGATEIRELTVILDTNAFINTYTQKDERTK